MLVVEDNLHAAKLIEDGTHDPGAQPEYPGSMSFFAMPAEEYQRLIEDEILSALGPLVESGTVLRQTHDAILAEARIPLSEVSRHLAPHILDRRPPGWFVAKLVVPIAKRRCGVWV